MPRENEPQMMVAQEFKELIEMRPSDSKKPNSSPVQEEVANDPRSTVYVANKADMILDGHIQD